MATRTVVVDSETDEVVYPTGHRLMQEFTAATKAATVPTSANAVGYETDTGTFYKATGTDAGDWSAVAGGLRAVLSADGSYVGFYDGPDYKGKAQLSPGAL